jgi:hypothetical protein
MLVLIYCALTYGPQFILHVVNPGALTERFNMSADTQYFALFVPLFLLLVFGLNMALPRLALPARVLWKWSVRMFESRLNTLLALVLIGLAINFSISEGISFRHHGDLLSEAGLSVGLVIFSKPYVVAWGIYHMLLVIRGIHPRPVEARIQALLFVSALIVSLTGSLDALPILWMLLFVVWSPQRIRAFMIDFGQKRATLKRTLLLVIAAPFLAALAVGIVAIGIINKLGVDGARELIDRIGIGTVAEQIMVRVSSSYASMISFAEFRLSDLGYYEKIARIPVENVPYRLSLLMRDPLPRPEITQVTRLNYLSYETDTHLERAGASPGLVSSAFFAAPFPLGFLLMAIYTVVIIRVVNLPFDAQIGKPRLAAAVFATSSIYPLFETPVDYLILIDPAILQFLLLIVAFVAASVRPAPRRAGAPASGLLRVDAPPARAGASR